MSRNILIIDYGMGNIQSVRNAFERLGCAVTCSSDASDIHTADALVLPGVGAFGEAAANLKASGLDDAIVNAVRNEGKPIMAICLGMQLLADESEERGNHRGLGLIAGSVRRIPISEGLRLPHMGWNELEIVHAEPIFKGVKTGDCVYFVHSFRFETDEQFVAARTDYGGDVVAAVQHERIFGLQFHPERSQTTGLRLLKNFIDFSVNLRGRTAATC